MGHRRQRDEVTRFVLLSTQRSGTSWCMERIASHPDVAGYGEVLLRTADGWSDWPPGAEDRPFYTTYRRERGWKGSRFRDHTELFRYLDYLYEPRHKLRAIGFKLMYDEARPYPEVLAYMKLRRVRVLHLVRENLLDLVLSREAMTHRRFVHARSEEQRESVKVHVDTTDLVSRLVVVENQRRFAQRVLRALRLRAYEFTYEDLSKDDAVWRGILHFIAVPDHDHGDLSARMLKLAPLSHRNGVENFDEVAQTLSGTRFERFLRP